MGWRGERKMARGGGHEVVRGGGAGGGPGFAWDAGGPPELKFTADASSTITNPWRIASSARTIDVTPRVSVAFPFHRIVPLTELHSWPAPSAPTQHRASVLGHGWPQLSVPTRRLTIS